MVVIETSANAVKISLSFRGRLVNSCSCSANKLRFGGVVVTELLDFTGTALRLIMKVDLSMGGEERGTEELTEDY